MKPDILSTVLAILLVAAMAGQTASKLNKRVVTSSEFPKPLGPYPHAVVAGGFVFVAGQAPINPKIQPMELGDIKSEIRLQLTNIATILEASNSSLENIVKISVHLVDLKDFDAMNDVYREFFKGDFPPRTTVQAGLRTGRRIAIDWVARVNE